MHMSDSRTPRPAMSDSEVIAGIRAGDMALYGLLVQRYHRQLYHTAGRMLRGSDEVADVLQEAHFRALTHIADFKEHSSFPTWLTSIALNVARTRMRKRSRLAEAGGLGDESDDRVSLVRSESPSPERQAMTQELHQSLREALGGLPPIYRTVFVLKEVEELSTADIVGRLGITTATVKTRLHRARKVLRVKLRAWDSPGATARVKRSWQPVAPHGMARGNSAPAESAPAA
jgi:RNA polymerase sigma-70 factor (ECF subfamily)